MLALPDNHQGAFLQAKQDIRLLVADLISRLYEKRGPNNEESLGSWDLALKLVDNQHVRREIQSFTTAERDDFQAAIQRSGRYRPMILAKLAAAGLPSQLSWLPLVESLFKERALSRAGAYGLWQFIASTGLRYGLQRDAWIDERLDPEKATDAAIAYLTDLHGMFGDWPKALAGYNCGEANVQRRQASATGEYMDFWDVYERLPLETRRYVPRLFAALMILEDPARFGMSLPTPDPPLPPLVTVQVTRPLELARLDAELGLAPGTLLGFNPELRARATPARPYDLRVPAGSETTLLAGIDQIPTWRPPVPQYATYTVRAGDTLSSIAQRYHTSVSAIQAASGLGRSTRLSIGQRLRLSGRAAAVAAPSGSSRATARSTAPATEGVHVVRSGDSLHALAQRYGTTVERLKQANHLTSNLLMPGQELRLP